MFVWNHFTNDARVLRECTALANDGFKVNLIAIHDPSNEGMKRFEARDGFNITRVSRYPKYLLFFTSMLRCIKKHKMLWLVIVAFFSVVGVLNFIAMLLMLMISILLLNSKVRTFLIRTHIFINMIWYGVKYKSEIYHSNDLNTLPQGIICAKIFRRKKLIYDSHEVQSSRTGYGKSAYYIEKFLIKFINKMIMTNETRANYVKELYKIEKPGIVHNYPFYTGELSIKKKIDLYELLDIPKDKPILLYQGGIQQGRGLEKIVEAISKFEDGIVVFIGDGKLKPKIIQMANEKGLNEKVRFLDKVPVDDLKYYTASAYLGFQVLNNVCYNHYSACSNKLFEYIMSNVPVIACNFPEIKKVVEDAKIGICIDSHNVDEIANGVNKLLGDKKTYNFYKENCKLAKEIYNWEIEKKALIDIYYSVIYKNNIKKDKFFSKKGSSLDTSLRVYK